ncbi:hypothetical protein MYU51_005227 [Penicillium brevicompactum]|uniref:uncharacterized protein n=1 Tax=Penicillium brevicompactum TaxID=5074 RepID=UPI00254198DB|nr:uncharacterized protein N7506_006819 [Penicillium brevicompactum]KAJ5333036.1 hypothetical protein N7506_006819 [Penicillium brevicompactum]
MRMLPFIGVDAENDYWRSETIASESSDTSDSVDPVVTLTKTPDTNVRRIIPGAILDGQDPGLSVSGATSEPPPSMETASVSGDSEGANPTGTENSWDTTTSESNFATAFTEPPLSTMTTTSIPSSTSSSIVAASTSTSTSASTSTTSTLISTSTTTQYPTQTPTSDPSAYSGGPSKTTQIAIAVPVSIVGLALILALIFFLLRRRRRERTSLPPPYHVATSQTTAVSTQELMIPKPQETRSLPPMAVPMPLVSPTLPRSPSAGELSMQHSQDGRGSHAELGTAIAVPVNRHSVGEEVRGSRQLARMPFEDFEDDEVGVGPARVDDDDVSDVSDRERRGSRRRNFDEVSDLSFNEVSPISPSSPEQRRFP